MKPLRRRGTARRAIVVEEPLDEKSYVGSGAVGVDRLRDQKTDRALRLRVPADERVELRTVIGVAQVRELVDEHVVEDPDRERREARRHADAAVDGRARP